MNYDHRKCLLHVSRVRLQNAGVALLVCAEEPLHLCNRVRRAQMDGALGSDLTLSTYLWMCFRTRAIYFNNAKSAKSEVDRLDAGNGGPGHPAENTH